MFAKSDVNGQNTNETYKFLRINSALYDKKSGNVKQIPWNFAKFLVNEQGLVSSYHEPSVDPSSLSGKIESMLGI